MNTNQHY